MRIERVLYPSGDLCYCGGRMLWVEMKGKIKRIVTGEDGKQKIVVDDHESTRTQIVCPNCHSRNRSSGMPAQCF